MPILLSHSFELISRSPEQTRRLGLRLGAMLKAGDVVALYGDLGAGKTTLVQGMAKGWGSLDNVTSPTFVLVNVYRRPDGLLLHHMDAYRLANALEAEYLDLDSMLATGALVVEWAERIQEALPENHLWVQLSWMGDEQRSLIITPHGKRFEGLVKEFRRQAVGG